MRLGGRKQQPLLRKQYRPIATAVLLPGAAAEPDEGCAVRARSPLIIASAWMTVLPPSMMCWVPTRTAFRATLLPVSVSIYSPLICFLDIVSCRADDGLRTWAGLGCGAWGRMRVRVVALYWKSYRELYMVTRSIAGSSIWVDYWERIDSFCKCLCACEIGRAHV